MFVTLTVREEIVRLAQEQGTPVVELIEQLIDKGLGTYKGRETVDSALDRIRALRSSGSR